MVLYDIHLFFCVYSIFFTFLNVSIIKCYPVCWNGDERILSTIHVSLLFN